MVVANQVCGVHQNDVVANENIRFLLIYSEARYVYGSSNFYGILFDVWHIFAGRKLYQLELINQNRRRYS